jgi:hypothetical protein
VGAVDTAAVVLSFEGESCKKKRLVGYMRSAVSDVSENVVKTLGDQHQGQTWVEKNMKRTREKKSWKKKKTKLSRRLEKERYLSRKAQQPRDWSDVGHVV